MSPLLPMKESSREVVVEVTRALQPHFQDITSEWRRAMFAEFSFDGRAMAALERLTIGTGFSIFSQTDFAAFYENLQYFGVRLAKLKVSALEVARALEVYQQLIDPYLRRLFPPARLPEAVAAMETLSSASFIAVSGAYFDAQKTQSDALLVGAGRGAFGQKPRRLAAASAGDQQRDVRRHLGGRSTEGRRSAGVASARASRLW